MVRQIEGGIQNRVGYKYKISAYRRSERNGQGFDIGNIRCKVPLVGSLNFSEIPPDDIHLQILPDGICDWEYAND